MRFWKKRKSQRKTVLAGCAVVRRDGITQKNYWETTNAEGGDEVCYSGGQALTMLDPKNLPIGARVELYVPDGE